MNNSQLLEKLKPIYTTLTVAKLESILDMFFNAKYRLPISQQLTEFREKTGVIMGRRQVDRTLKALEKLGYELAPIKYEKKGKQQLIEEVMKTSTSSEKIIRKVYENIVSINRRSHGLMAKALSTPTSECHVSTVKNITQMFIEIGVVTKPVKIQTKSGPKSSFKNGVISLDEGIVRWNPPHKLMPEAFKHLDNAF